MALLHCNKLNYFKKWSCLITSQTGSNVYRTVKNDQQFNFLMVWSVKWLTTLRISIH